MKIINIILWFVIAIISAGCGGPSAIMVKPEALKNVRNIAILEINEPFYQIMDLGSSTPWGAIAAQSDAKEIKPKFVALLKKEKFSFEKNLTQELHRSLRKSGYKTFAIKVKRPAGLGKFLESYKKYNLPKIDALLDVTTVSAGYVVENVFTSSHLASRIKNACAIS